MTPLENLAIYAGETRAVVYTLFMMALIFFVGAIFCGVMWAIETMEVKKHRANIRVMRGKLAERDAEIRKLKKLCSTPPASTKRS